jgi:PAS domain S-box-containing protein
MNKELYEKIFQQIKSPVMIMTTNQIIEANVACLKLFNVDDKKLLNEFFDCKKLIEKFNKTTDYKLYQSISVTSKKQLNLELSFTTIDEELYLIDLITIEKDALYDEITLLSANNKELFNNSPNAIAIINNEGIIIDINETFENIFEFERFEAIGQNIDDLIVRKKDRKQAKKLFDQVLKQNKLEINGKRKTKSNEILELEITGYPVVIDGIIKGNFVIYKDITEFSKTKDLLDETQQYFDQLFNRSLIPIAILDENETILNINKMFENLFKYTQDELIGKNINNFIVPEDYVEESQEFKHNILLKKPLKKKTIRKDKYNNAINVIAVGQPIIINDEVKGIFAMYNDIRKETQFLNDLKKQKALFEQLFHNFPDAIILLNEN